MFLISVQLHLVEIHVTQFNHFTVILWWIWSWSALAISRGGCGGGGKVVSPAESPHTAPPSAPAPSLQYLLAQTPMVLPLLEDIYL